MGSSHHGSSGNSLLILSLGGQIGQWSTVEPARNTKKKASEEDKPERRASRDLCGRGRRSAASGELDGERGRSHELKRGVVWSKEEVMLWFDTEKVLLGGKRSLKGVRKEFFYANKVGWDL